MSFAVCKSAAFDIIGTSASRVTSSTTAARSSIVDIGENRRVTLEVHYNASASGQGLEIVPVLSMSTKLPAVADDEWSIPGVWDGTVTAAAGVTPATGGDWTTGPAFGRVVHNPIAFRTTPTTGASDKIRVSFSLNVEAYRWLHLQYVETGTAGASIWVRAVLHA